MQYFMVHPWSQEHETPAPSTPAAKPGATSPGRHLSDRDVQKLILVTPSRGAKDVAGQSHHEEAPTAHDGQSAEVGLRVAMLLLHGAASACEPHACCCSA